MSAGYRRAGWIVAALLAVAAIVAAALLLPDRHSPTPTPRIAATAPSTHPATTTASTQPAAPKNWFELVRRNYPALPATQPFDLPVDMANAAHLQLSEPIHLDRSGHLWITRTDAPRLTRTTRKDQNEQAHVVGDRVVYVHWAISEAGVWMPSIVVRSDGNQFDLISEFGRAKLCQGADYDWSRAISTLDAFIVPTATGASAFVFADEKCVEHRSPPLAESPLGHVILTLDWRGVMAWMPPAPNFVGAKGMARFAQGQWTRFDSDDWPAGLLHIVPLLDGSILQIRSAGEGKVELKTVLLESTAVNQAMVLDLIDQLSDADFAKRESAFAKLTRYGPGLWPILEKLPQPQPPETRARVHQLLKARVEPTLGGMTLKDDKLRLLLRTAEGGAVYVADAGMVVATATDPVIIAPAYLAIFPSQPIHLLPPYLANLLGDDAFLRGKQSITFIAGEWIVSSLDTGPQRFLGNQLMPLVRKNERDFTDYIGQDARGRWLFRSPRADSATTLVLDPTLPDPRPRLPVWDIQVKGGQVGWDEKDCPAMKAAGAWALTETEWRALDVEKERFFPAADSTTPATTQSADAPLLIAPDGSKYFDGRESLRCQLPSGKTIEWKLPDIAQGTVEPRLIRARNGKLFLFNMPGRVLCIKPTPDAAEPFALDATFTHKIPSAERPLRIWLDPAGRIALAYAPHKLALLFPEGHIPPKIATLMPASEEEADE